MFVQLLHLLLCNYFPQETNEQNAVWKWSQMFKQIQMSVLGGTGQ